MFDIDIDQITTFKCDHEDHPVHIGIRWLGDTVPVDSPFEIRMSMNSDGEYEMMQHDIDHMVTRFYKLVDDYNYAMEVINQLKTTPGWDELEPNTRHHVLKTTYEGLQQQGYLLDTTPYDMDSTHTPIPLPDFANTDIKSAQQWIAAMLELIKMSSYMSDPEFVNAEEGSPRHSIYSNLNLLIEQMTEALARDGAGHIMKPVSMYTPDQILSEFALLEDQINNLDIDFT